MGDERGHGGSHVALNPLLLCAYQALFSLLFPVAVFSLYWHDTLGMSVTTMLSVQAMFGLVLAAAEFPSGYVADRLGHRLAILLGTAIVTLGWGVYAGARGLFGVVLAEAVLGAGFALVSGADSALLYESLRETGREHEFARWYARVRVVAQVAEGVGALCAGYLFARSPRLPFVLETGAFALALGLAFALCPMPTAAPLSHGHLTHVRVIVRRALRDHTLLPRLVVCAVAFSLMSFLPVWLVPLHARARGLDAAAIGPFWAAANFTTALGSLLAERTGARLGLVGVLRLALALGVLGYGLLCFAPGLASPFGYFALTLARGFHAPELHHREQRELPSADRAALLSFRNFLFRGSYVVLGPLIGLGVDAFGMVPTLRAIALFVLVPLALSVRALSRALAAAPGSGAV
jgi:MFS family permease